MSPIMFGLGVELDLVYGSRWLIDELQSFGFTISNDEIRRYKQSILADRSLSTLSPPPDAISQFVADNADSNTATLDGHGTFHGLGTIFWSKHRQLPNDGRVKRMAKCKMEDICDRRGIKILTYVEHGAPALKSLKFKPILELQFPLIIPPTTFYSNLLWRCLTIPKWVNWSGFMECAFRNTDTVDQDNIFVLPLTDLDPSDHSTLYSCIRYIEAEVKKTSMEETSLTFDQPLYVKALEIITKCDIKTIVLRLGGFHLLMSAVGSIFTTMRGSGISDVLAQIFAPNSVIHMMSGKSISRALRALHLLDAALTTKLLEKIEVEDALRQFPSDTPSLEEIVHSAVLAELGEKINDLETKLQERSRTAALWLQFLHYIEIVHNFILSEKVKDWEGHLTAATNLLNLFAATGHVHYAKSARIYIQLMRQLPEEHPKLYAFFTENGGHAVQRTQHSCNGLWSDLVIEQVLMRSIKSRGGLTHGRGLTESVRTQWVYTMHHCVAIHEACTSLSGKKNRTSEQHKDLDASRRERDRKDLAKLLEWFEDHNPFDEGVSELKSLSTGLTARPTDGINCDQAETIGRKMQRSMDGVSYNDSVIKRSSQIKTLQDLQPGVKIGDGTIQVDPLVLFLRCTSIAQRIGEDVQEYFKYEMALYPPSLFKGMFMRKPVKAELADVLLDGVTSVVSMPELRPVVIIDGGWLINKVQWKTGVTYTEILQQYEAFLDKRFGPTVVVFDGYESSTKDHEHLRRNIGKTSAAEISIDLGNKVHHKQDVFLRNAKNKSQLISRLTDHLDNSSHCVRCSDKDADTLIVKETIRRAKNGQSVKVVANDTDILVLLIHHWRDDMADIFKHREVKKKTGMTVQEISIRQVYDSLDPDTRNNILFIHAWSGCDTTSQVYGQGKAAIFKYIGSPDFRKIAKVLAFADTQKVAGEAAITLFQIMYGGSGGKTLEALRYTNLQTQVVSSNTIDPQRLPPTSGAAYQHGLRVNLQVSVWRSLDENIKNALDWGWSTGPHGMEPITTDLPVAPANVLNYIRCGCKAQNKLCGSNLCSCRKNGLKCVEACRGCRGDGCLNSEPVDLDDGISETT